MVVSKLALVGFTAAMAAMAAIGGGSIALAQPAPRSQPCDDLPHQAQVLGCAHAQPATATLGEAPPAPPFPGSAGGETDASISPTDVLNYFLDLSITPSPANLNGVNTIQAPLNNEDCPRSGALSRVI